MCLCSVDLHRGRDGLDREKEVLVAELLHVRALSQSQARGVWLLAWFMMLHVFFSSSSPCSPSTCESARRDQDCTNCVRVESLVA